MKKVIGFTLASLLLASPAMAAGDAAAGKTKSAVCSACHGATGVAMIPGYPNLKGQNEQYLVSALKAYKTKARTGGNALVMQPQALMLSDADMANLAAYYSSLK
ncbi:c-type cytochrome [Aliivibrio kagoshimensis]|jgi:cytochrome c553|uniref:c-type cytochrome n=1 Tax=Aliivibrio kagoshimensis TaxID=2910230 RepID=UPI003D143E31